MYNTIHASEESIRHHVCTYIYTVGCTVGPWVMGDLDHQSIQNVFTVVGALTGHNTTTYIDRHVRNRLKNSPCSTAIFSPERESTTTRVFVMDSKQTLSLL